MYCRLKFIKLKSSRHQGLLTYQARLGKDLKYFKIMVFKEL